MSLLAAPFIPAPITFSELRSASQAIWQVCRDNPKIPARLHPPNQGGCALYCNEFRDAFEDMNIDYMVLRSGEFPQIEIAHAFLAVKTSDQGIVIIDPTITQVFADYPNSFFVGSASELARIIKQHGGPKTNIPDTVEIVEEYYFNALAGDSRFHSTMATDGVAPENQRDWVCQWDTLGPFAPHFEKKYTDNKGFVIPEDYGTNRSTYADLTRRTRSVKMMMSK